MRNADRPFLDNDVNRAGYRLQAEDTPYEIERLLIEGYRRMSPAEKARRVAEDCVALETLVVAGIRARHPGASGDELRRRLAELRLGKSLAQTIYGDADAVRSE